MKSLFVLLVCLSLLVGIGQAQVDISGKGTGNTITITNDHVTMGAQIQDSIATAQDTTQLKTTNSIRCYMQQMDVDSNAYGGGDFVKVDSAYAENFNGICFEHPTAGYQWIRTSYLNDGIVHAVWTGVNGDFAVSDTVGGISRNDAIQLQKGITFGDKFVFETNGSYYVTTNIDIADKVIIGNNATIYSDQDDEILYAIGTKGDTTSLVVDAGELDGAYTGDVANNKLVVKDPSVVAQGDIILIQSD